ncbi:MAG: hypothetical protein LBQ94_12825 [Treponema sp.]|jgi:hypothetical protein|nr:hypothetical protein [Treponema sp.]
MKNVLLILLDKDYSIYKFNMDFQIDNNILGNDFISITKTKGRYSWNSRTNSSMSFVFPAPLCEVFG